jgi:AcrR family transcriptional regulator
MGRPSLADSRRAQILDAYEECVLQFGMEARSLEAIADQAGIKRSVVRHYMGNRAELRRAFVERIISRATRAYGRRICGTSSTKSSPVRMSTPRPNARPAATESSDSPSPCSAESPQSPARAR